MSVEETGSLELFEGKQQEITRQELVERVSEHVNRILRRNLYISAFKAEGGTPQIFKRSRNRKFTGKRVFDFFYSGISVKRNEDG